MQAKVFSNWRQGEKQGGGAATNPSFGGGHWNETQESKRDCGSLSPAGLLLIESFADHSMVDMFFERGESACLSIIYIKEDLKTLKCTLRKLPGGFRIFWAHSNRTVRLQVLGYKKCQIFGRLHRFRPHFKKSGFYC